MTSSDIRSLIREVLAQELARIGQERLMPEKVEEAVSIGTNEELQAFAQRVLKLGRDKSIADKIVKGDYVFRLEGNPGNPKGTTEIMQGKDSVRIEAGFLSERRVATFAPEIRVLQLGPGVRFTPLARDRLRQRKIAVERIK